MTYINPALKSYVLSFFSKGHERSIKAKKNIIGSLLIKGLSIAISLVSVPLTLNYVNPTKFGIYLTLSSIVVWFSFFDIGLTQGLRNKFTEAKAKGDDDLAQVYVSTTYAILGIISLTIWILFFIGNYFLDWSRILNAPESMQNELSVLALIVFTYFCLNFVFKILSTVIIANQQPAISSIIDLVGQALSLVVVGILVLVTKGSLIKLGIAFCAVPMAVLIAANFFLFSGRFSRYRPLLSKVNFSHAKDLFNLGVVFFVIQVAFVIQYQTSNIIIAQNFGTLEVTSYNIVYKYFGVLNMLFMIFLTPFWSASTEAYFKNDISWIRNGIKKYNQLNLVVIFFGLIMLIASGTVYRLWLGEGKVNIAFSLSFWGFLYFNVMIFGSKYVFFLNSINALRLQFISSIISPFLYVAIVLLLIKYFHFGVYSIFIASIIANFNGLLLAPLQYYLIVNRNKKGIWIR